MTCLCIGPQRGEPLCPCQMQAAKAHIVQDFNRWTPTPQPMPLDLAADTLNQVMCDIAVELGCESDNEMILAAICNLKAERDHWEGLVSRADRMQGMENPDQAVADWMMARGYATGHGDTTEDMLGELEGQIRERCAKIAECNMPRNEPGEYANGRFAAADAIRAEANRHAHTQTSTQGK